MIKWRLINEEHRGAVRDKVWVTNGVETALFKPDTDKHESDIEYEFYRIASALGISCAKTEATFLFETKGTLSYDFKTDNTKVYCPVSNLHLKSGLLTYKTIDSDCNDLQKIDRVSFCTLISKAPHVLTQLVNMVYIDCLLCNKDRHGSNWELIIDEANFIHAIAPLFDHGNSMLYSDYDEIYDRSLVLWDDTDEIEPLHFEMFEKLVRHSPQLVKELLDKTKCIQLNDFVFPRFEKMKTIYMEVVGYM